METNKRKPIAIPVLIVLLAVSFTMNVLLYTKNIQHGRDQLEQTGGEIIQTAEMSKNLVEQLLQFIDVIQDESTSETAGKRATAHAAAVYMASHDALLRLQQFAEETPLEEMRVTNATNNMAEFQKNSMELLTTIGEGKGSLADEEQAKLAQLKQTLQQINEQWTDFPFQYAGYYTSLIRLANGQEWLPIAANIDAAVAGDK
ncbi:hypothetical protein ACFSTH_05215 [Paenibacillus yanchengensis]|uniref:LemA family protein n=1 Tax=Paenibacillus yanchengensis TaxID=2035833 RepID=A0ABW4YK67_9BACL